MDHPLPFEPANTLNSLLCLVPPDTVDFSLKCCLASHFYTLMFKQQGHLLSVVLTIVLPSYMDFVLVCKGLSHLFVLCERGKERKCRVNTHSFKKSMSCSFSLDCVNFLLTQAKGVWNVIITP